VTELEYVEQALGLAEPGEREARFRKDPRLREILPELYLLGNVPQPPDHHPEGDALTHTLLAVRLLETGCDRRLAWGALLHDVGKASTTREIGGRLRAFGHDLAGAELAVRILRRLGMEEGPRDDVVWLVRHHMFALCWQLEPDAEPSRRQARFIADPRFSLLLDLLELDARASGANPGKLAQAAFYRQALARLSRGPR